ncbi:hypothetical protein QBD00_002019 [Ochrobactrum sp. AN78]|nr:hypothetical protein [Ochrobactrum sp. AN78]
MNIIFGERSGAWGYISAQKSKSISGKLDV